MLSKEQIAQRIALEIQDGDYVNLGIGIPTLVANYIPHDMNVVLQSENGLLGIGPFPLAGNADPNLINAGKQTITMQPGAALFDSAESFAMIRGGHIGLAILGAMEVSENGDLANWKIPGKMVKGMGGAMDLAASPARIIIAMQHCDKNGKSKLVKQCGLPLTRRRCVQRIFTELAVIDIHPKGGFILREIAPGHTMEEVKAATEGILLISEEIKVIPVF
jgi:3-oxoacid CoA-transferase subunit B